MKVKITLKVGIEIPEYPFVGATLPGFMEEYRLRRSHGGWNVSNNRFRLGKKRLSYYTNYRELYTLLSPWGSSTGNFYIKDKLVL